MIGLKRIFSMSVLMFISCMLLFSTEVDSTISKKKKDKKDRKKQDRPDGVAYDKKKYPTKCHVCRLMVEEIKVSMKGETKELTEEQIKQKKRKDRRKTKGEIKREKNMPILVAIEEVCDKMLEYIPQEEDRSKFRYLKKKDLKDTKSLIMAQKENEDASKVLEDTFDRFRHPETNRMMSLCDELINLHENDLLKWNTMPDNEDLFDYLCRERVFKAENVSDSCLDQVSVKDDLWTQAFDAIFEKHPELKHQEF